MFPAGSLGRGAAMLASIKWCALALALGLALVPRSVSAAEFRIESQQIEYQLNVEFEDLCVLLPKPPTTSEPCAEYQISHDELVEVQAAARADDHELLALLLVAVPDGSRASIVVATTKFGAPIDDRTFKVAAAPIITGFAERGPDAGRVRRGFKSLDRPYDLLTTAGIPSARYVSMDDQTGTATYLMFGREGVAFILVESSAANIKHSKALAQRIAEGSSLPPAHFHSEGPASLLREPGVYVMGGMLLVGLVYLGAWRRKRRRSASALQQDD